MAPVLELNQRRWELALRLAGEDGVGWEGDDYSDRDRALPRQWLRWEMRPHVAALAGRTSEEGLRNPAQMSSDPLPCSWLSVFFSSFSVKLVFSHIT